MINVRETLQVHLKLVHPRVYFLKAPNNAQFPYIIYEFELSDLGDETQMLTLDIDGWDNNSDTTPLETMMDNIHKSLNKKIMINNHLAVFFSLDRKLPLTDPDPQIIRRKYIYHGRLYER